MKIHAKIRSIEKKEIVSENADGKREKKIVHVAKMDEPDGMRLTLKSDDPFEDLLAVGAAVSITLMLTQARLDETKEVKK